MQNIKPWHIAIVVILIFLVLFGWYFYRQGKKTTSIQMLPNDLAGTPSGTGQIGASNDEIKTTATAIYNDIDGFNLTGHDNEPYERSVLYSNTDVVKLYNAFNTMYQNELKETLTQALIGEKFWENKTPDTLILRLQKLNCR